MNQNITVLTGIGVIVANEVILQWEDLSGAADGMQPRAAVNGCAVEWVRWKGAIIKVASFPISKLNRVSTVNRNVGFVNGEFHFERAERDIGISVRIPRGWIDTLATSGQLRQL